MSAKRYTQEQILKVLKEIEGGASMAPVGRSHGVCVQSTYDWRTGAIQSHMLQRLLTGVRSSPNRFKSFGEIERNFDSWYTIWV